MIGAAVAAMVQVGFSGSVLAATITWDGGGANDNLNTAANWVGDILPVAADSLVFTGLVRNAPIVSVPSTYVGLTFDVNAGAFTFGGANALTTTGTGAVGIINNSLLTQTFNVPVNIAAGTVNAAGVGGNIVFNGLVNVGNGTATNVIFTGPSNITLAGGIAGIGAAGTGGAINKQGTGTLFVTTSNAAWGGDVFINGGTLRINNATALGTTGRIETALTSGGTGLGALELDGPNYTLAKPVTNRFRQGTTINEVMLRNITGNHTISNVVTGSGGSQLNWESVAGNLSIASLDTTPNGGARTLRLIGAGNGELQGWTPNSGNVLTLIKEGAGTWTMRSAVAANMGTATLGAVTVNGGNLVLEAGHGEKVTAATTINGGTLTVVSASGTDGEISYNPLTATSSNIIVKAGGTLDASSFTSYNLQAAQTVVLGGTFKAGNITAFGDNTIYLGDVTTSAAGTGTIVGNLNLSNQFSTATGGIHFDLANTNTVGGGVNDLLSVQGALNVDGSSGPINLRLHPTAGLANGTYRLIEHTGGALNAADFTLTGFTAGTTRQTLSVGTAAGQVNLVVAGSPGNVVWTGNNSSTWDIGVTGTQNWLNGATPDRYYDFDNVTFTDAPANKTVDLSTVITPGSVTVNANGDYLFQGAGSLNGPTGITKSGNGKLTIANSGPNTITGPININAGSIEVGDGGIGTGTITNNGTLIYNNSAVAMDPGAISGTGGLVMRGAGNLTLNDASTYTGSTSIEAGTVIAANANAFGDAASGTTVADGATVYFVNPALSYAEPFTIAGAGSAAAGVFRSGGAIVTTLTGAITLGGNVWIQNDGNSSLVINNANGISGTGPITKFGGGSLVIVGTGHTWTGGVNVGDGTLVLGAGTELGAIPGQVTVAGPNGTLAFGSTLASTYSSAVQGDGVISAGNTGAVTTLTGDLTGFTGRLQTPTFGVQSTLIVATPTNATIARIDAPGSGEGYGIIRLANQNALAANPTLEVFAQQDGAGKGRIELAENITINAGVITLNQRNVAGATGSPAVLTPAIAGLLTPAISSVSGNNTLTGPITLTTGGSFAGLEAAAGSTFTVNGTIKPLASAASARQVVFMGAGTGVAHSVISDDTAVLNVYKIGTGTWTLDGANTYSGVTRVVGGTLRVDPAAQAPIVAGANGADINGGKLSLLYSGSGAALVSQVGTTLDAGYDQTPKFSAGQFRSTLLEANRLLGWRDTGTSVDIAYTLPGDSNLSFSVTFDDLLILAQNYGAAGKVWAQGDSNYDGLVNFDDLLALAQNYGGSVALANDLAANMGESFANDWALALSVVPEPASLGLIAGGLMVLRRRR
jgi:autotransporter-associated beta strand protein